MHGQCPICLFLTSIVRNVFDFDSYNTEIQETIIKTMQKHGIPFGATEAIVNLAKMMPLPKFDLKGTSWGLMYTSRLD
jgi:hypothetical protein